jgi:hypothetical protein
VDFLAAISGKVVLIFLRVALFLLSNIVPQNKGYLSVEMSDAPGQTARAGNLVGDELYPLSCTALLSGSIGGVFVLY